MTPSPRSLLRPFGPDREERFEAYVAAYRPVFQRSDQFLRFRAYLRGLLGTAQRKNVESIAASAAAVMMVEADLAQALQHFVSHSPWDHRRLLSAVRAHSATRRADPAAVWVVHDAAFAKKGRHSVGVLRQHARAVGKKINCQLGVFVAQVGPNGYFPLAARLYLPPQWLKDHEASAGRAIPDDDRRPQSKAEIAAGLLEALRADGETVRPVAAEGGYLAAPNFAEVLAGKGFTSVADSTSAVAEALAGSDELKAELGLDHFEGRTWHGWHHHVSLVFAAHHFLAND